ncbi:TIR domain-containing protein [Rufibacter sediminis]|uniref:Nucleotide-binding protein n=1 Tax=Rufibacter sediminis TaxID=2762756 RepID=A0ABR6VQR3_9BACT|nr:nucleotide-binding protein [Rufibacter sediminis]MBC3539257.1 nucleotide-binding protein [Rufibacter sediminis]
MKKPRLFIGCSVESLNIADAINENMDHTLEVTIWRNGTFSLSNNTIDDLVKMASSVDFAVFIFSPDDLLTIRAEQKKVVRDNVIFELGLFIGKIGKERCYIVKPRGVDLHLPTDLLGMTTADYEPNRSDNDLTSAVNVACNKIKREVERLGLLNSTLLYKAENQLTHIVNNNLSDIDFRVLSSLISTYTQAPVGWPIWTIKNNIREINDNQIDLCVIKLERLGYLEKENAVENFDNVFYAYKLSQSGIEYLLQNESKVSALPSLNDDLSNDDLPF